ncbi:MAG: glycosyltransferase [Ilumatobacteraceae bacterium]
MLPADAVAPSHNVTIVRSAPHGPILREASLVITHCGHGTVMKALAHGVPMVCIPMGRDQSDTAARVVHHGAGMRLSPRSCSTRITAAVREVLTARPFLVCEHDPPAWRVSATTLVGCQQVAA